jgi:hypothetical protein
MSLKIIIENWELRESMFRKFIDVSKVLEEKWGYIIKLRNSTLHFFPKILQIFRYSHP